MARLVGEIGLITLSCGTGAYRVREAMYNVAEVLGLKCDADIGLLAISYTCFDDAEQFSQTVSVPSSGVNTDKLNEIEHFTKEFEDVHASETLGTVHDELDMISGKPGNYSAFIAGLASGTACMAFVFLLGGGLVEMAGALAGAFVGNFIRRIMLDRKITLLACVAAGVGAACLTYLGVFTALQQAFGVVSGHQAGYIGSMLFVIPGFPLITSGLDFAREHMRSGLERLAYALMIIVTATSAGWLFAWIAGLSPGELITPEMPAWTRALLIIAMSFIGVFGFSIMFNSTPKMAAAAGIVGAAANTLRLELVAYTAIPAAGAAFIGALTAGLLASLVNRELGYPRISITVPSIVIMVPGLYMYTAIWQFGAGNVTLGTAWLTRAALIVLFLPLGLIAARIVADPEWRRGA
jgi:uncharacterized membrane protein YjjP (DUF1212 family)